MRTPIQEAGGRGLSIGGSLRWGGGEGVEGARREGGGGLQLAMAIGDRSRLRFYFVTAPLPCPYLRQRVERRVVTELAGAAARDDNDRLSEAGFRRSHGIAYAPACSGCTACVSVRMPVADFAPSRSQRRVLRRNADLSAHEGLPMASAEQFALFASYQRSRHGEGEMARMTYAEYQAMIEDTPVDSRLVEFREPGGGLVGACLADWLGNGISAVYSFFDPAPGRRSLGIYTILWLIERARSQGLRFVYLGYWVDGSRKMAYKASFRPLEAFGPQGWQPLGAGPGHGDREAADALASP